MLKVVIFDLVEGLQAAGATKTPFLRIKFNMHVKYWPFLPANRLKRRAQCPDIAGQHHVQHFPRVAYAASASGAAFKPMTGSTVVTWRKRQRRKASSRSVSASFS